MVDKRLAVRISTLRTLQFKSKGSPEGENTVTIFAVGFIVPSVVDEAACCSSVIHFPQHPSHSFLPSAGVPCHSRHQNIDWFWLMCFYGCYSIRSFFAKSKRSLKFMRGDTHLSRFICLHRTIAWHVVFLMGRAPPRSASTYWCGQSLSDDGRQRSSWVTSLHQAQEPTLKGNHFVCSLQVALG